MTTLRTAAQSAKSTSFGPDPWRVTWWRSLLGSVAGMAVSIGSAPATLAQSAYGAGSPEPSAPIALPTVSVQGAPPIGDYKTDQPSLPKLTEPLLNTPQTINVVPRQVLDDQGVTTLRDALRNVPGVSLNAGEGGAQGDSLTIRGFSARNDIYLDGMRDFGSYYRDPFHLEDIQVLKGPASILFGRGSTGGVVEQDSKRPQPSPFIDGTLTFGSDLTRRLTADVNQPLPEWGQGAAIRLNVMGQDGNVADRDVARNSRFGLAPSLALGLGTPTRLNLDYYHQSEYDIPDYGLPWFYSAASGTPSAIARPAPLDQTQSKYYGFEHGNYLRSNVDIVTAKAEHDVDSNLTLSNQIRYGSYQRVFDITEPQFYTAASIAAPGGRGVSLNIPPNTPLGSLVVARNQLVGHSLETFLQDQLDITARFATGVLDHTLRAGIEAGEETSHPFRSTTIGPYSTTPLLSPDPGDSFGTVNTFPSSETDTTARGQAVYLLDTIKLGEQWQLLAGLRWDRFASDTSSITYALNGTGTVNPRQSRIDRKATYRTALVYKPVPAGSVYFATGTSFNPSAESLSLSAANQALPPEETQSYEIGTKWDLLGGALALSGALFRSEKTNMQEPDPNNSLFNVLAGSGIAEGGELQVSGHITENWQIISGYAYTYSAVTKSTRTGPGSDLGHRLANTPAHTFNLWTEYRTPWKIELGAGVNVVGSRYASTTPTTAGGVAFFKEVPAYWTLGAMAKYPFNEHVALQLNLYNLTDNKYYDQIHPAHVVPGAGTTALMTLALKY
jgi:catecholate siderophore receptor